MDYLLHKHVQSLGGAVSLEVTVSEPVTLAWPYIVTATLHDNDENETLLVRYSSFSKDKAMELAEEYFTQMVDLMTEDGKYKLRI